VTLLAPTVLEARPSVQMASPGITFRLRLEEMSGSAVHAVALRCEVRIEPRGRRYTANERERLYELFGDSSQWDRSLRAVTWTHATLVVPAFVNRVDLDLAVACSYDLQVASGKYLHAIRDGDVPLRFLFSGTMFRANGGPLSIEPVPWDVEAAFRMPAATWRDAMDGFFPGGGWIRLQSDTIDRLQAFRGRHAVVSWDEAIDRLLQATATERTA
jgi:hypothetical protein